MKRYLDLLQRHGIHNLARIIFARVLPFEKKKYEQALKNGKVYMGEHLSARQGPWRRHAYMERLVRHIETAGEEGPEILEVGSWAGGSAIIFCNAVKKNFQKGRMTCVDVWEPFYHTKDLHAIPFLGRSHIKAIASGKVFGLFQHNMKAAGFGGMVSFYKTSFSVWNTSKYFDLIYIDGDHRYNNTFCDLEKADGLLKVGGFLCGDDLELQYDEVDHKICHDYLDKDLIYDGKIAKRHFHPGVTLAVHNFFGSKVSAYEGFWVMKKIAPRKYVPFAFPTGERGL